MNLEEFFPIQISEEEAGLRLDQILVKRFPEVSRSRWARVMEAGIVFADSKKAKSSLRVESGHQITLQGSLPEENVVTKPIKLSERGGVPDFRGPNPVILFEDDHMLVIDKPVGLSVHPGAGTPLEETLVAWAIKEHKISAAKDKLLQWGDEILEQERPGIVHRLDKGTSGCMVIAKHPEAHTKLAEQFSSKKAGRNYWAYVHGNIDKLRSKNPVRLDKMLQEFSRNFAFRITEEGDFSLSTPIDRDPKNRLRQAVVGSGGKQALTHFRVLQKEKDMTWLDVSLETGRTHQIRVHLSFLGHPILGDNLYGGREADRIYLHAHTLYLEHPHSGEALKIKSHLESIQNLSQL